MSAEKQCESATVEAQCELAAGHDGLHIADHGYLDGFVTWSDDDGGGDAALAALDAAREAGASHYHYRGGQFTNATAAAVIRAYLDALDPAEVAESTAHGWEPAWAEDAADIIKAVRP